MKLATLADAPATLNINDRAMWVLGFNAAVEAATADLKQWEKARFGFFHANGSFEELPPYSGWEEHPQAHAARWVGGSQDAQLLRAALAAGVVVPPGGQQHG